jgi:hypothetical protein
MAITRAQIAKQLLEEGGRVGLRFGSKGPGQASREQKEQRDARDRGMGMGGKQRSTRNPMSQFSGGANTARGEGVTFIDQARKEVNPLGILTEIPGSIGFVSRALTPNPFGFSSKPSKTFVDTRGSSQQMGKAPLWAQLGFNSEEEYLSSLQANETTDQETKPEDLGLRYRFAAEGGIMNDDVVGGEMDFESARQMYGLGKLVKKVTRTVKKIAKSPIGKAAIVGAGFGLAGMGPFKGLQSSGFSKFLFGLPGGNPIVSPTKGLFGQGGKFALGKGKLGIGSLIGGTSLLAGLMTPKPEDEEDDEDTFRGEGLDIADIRSRPRDFLAPRFMAEGGSTEKEPVAKKTMPLLDMDGKEMDLRQEGGFVPIGRMEKADDVPARLSKNEFVFTADAVRNAGDGSVDKGAEVMYNMMKNLEAGGDVSEESQGLEGARKMFQTSQRLEEVL